MLGKIKKLFSKEEPTQNVKYTIYKYDLNKRSGKWRWRKMVEIEQYIEANQIEDFPEDGYYQLREIGPAGVNVKWTVMVDGGEVVEYDPELPSNIPVVQQQGGQQQDPMESIGRAIQYLKTQKQMLEDLGLIKDPKREMIETLTMLKELEEIKSTANSILKPQQQAKSMSDAPWWATAAMEMLPTMASMASQMTPVQQYPQQQYLQQQYQQYQQPVQQQPQPQEDEDDIGFEPPTVEDVRRENMIQEAEEKIQEEIEEFVAPEPKPTPEPEPKAPEPKPEPKPKEKIEKPKPVKNNVDKEMLDLGNDLLDDIDEVE